MAKICSICGKGPRVGNTVSHSHRKTKRRWLPNLQSVQLKKGEKRVYLCTQCLKNLNGVRSQH